MRWERTSRLDAQALAACVEQQRQQQQQQGAATAEGAPRAAAGGGDGTTNEGGGSAVTAAVVGLLVDRRVTKVICNAKHGLAILRAAGVEVAGPMRDPLVAHWLLKGAACDAASPHAAEPTGLRCDEASGAARDSLPALAKLYGTTGMWVRVGDALRRRPRSRLAARDRARDPPLAHLRAAPGAACPPTADNPHTPDAGLARACAEALCCGMVNEVSPAPRRLSSCCTSH
jgi:hypothetical protein